jgi:hypothetical protein
MSDKNRKAAGTKRELKEVHLRRDQGYVAFRTPASMGVCDVIAMKAQQVDYEPWSVVDLSEVLMEEVKANKGNPFMHFRRPEREALRKAAARAGATALLVHWPPYGARREYRVEDWPNMDKEAE